MKKNLLIIFMCILMVFVAVSCDEPKHEHSYGTEWKYDDTNHWHECESGEKKDVAKHKFGSVNEELVKKCDICGYSEKVDDAVLVSTAEDFKKALGDGGTIYLGSDITLNEALTLNKTMTIDLNDKTLAVSENAEFDITSSLTLKNGKIKTNENSTVTDYLFYLTKAGSLAFDGVTLNVELEQKDCWEMDLIDIEVSADSEGTTLCPSLVVTASELTVKSDATWPCYLVYIYGDNALENTTNKALISISESTLSAGPKSKDKISGSTIKIDAPAESTIVGSTISGGCNSVVDLSAGIHTIKNTTITSTKAKTGDGDAYALKIGGNGNGVGDNSKYISANVSVEEVTLKVFKEEAVALEVEGNAYGITPKISGAIKAYLTGTSDTLDSSGKYLKLDDNAIVDLKYNDIVAKISKGGTTQAYYTSLYDAVLAAKDGETVILLCDASGSGLKSEDTVATETRAITIDFNNHTYTMDSNSVGSSGTQTQAMHWGKSLTGLTLKNGTFAVSERADDSNGNNVRTNFNMAMQCYIPLTATNMTFDLANVPNEQYDSTYNEPYKGTDKPHFNCYDTTTFTNCTITLNTENDYGLLAGENTTTEGKVTLDNTKLTGNATFEAVGKGSITLKNGSTINGDIRSQFTDSNNEIKTETKDNVTTYTYVVKASD